MTEIAKNTDPADADPRNVPGDFYVAKDCCLLCGVPQHFAPDLFGESKTGCWVGKQPVTLDEKQRMLKVLGNQELGCIRYRGRDAETLNVLSGLTKSR